MYHLIPYLMIALFVYLARGRRRRRLDTLVEDRVTRENPALQSLVEGPLSLAPDPAPREAAASAERANCAMVSTISAPARMIASRSASGKPRSWCALPRPMHGRMPGR